MTEEYDSGYDRYAGKSASDLSFDEFLKQVALEQIDLHFFNARKYGAERGSSLSLDVYSSAWFEDDEDRTKGPIADPEFFVNATYAVDVLNESGARLARVEAGYHLSYYSFVPMDDKTFVEFAKTQVREDVWPNLHKLMEELLDKLELREWLEPHFQSIGPNRDKFWPKPQE